MIEYTNKPSPPALFRWIILFFISVAMFGNYYIYDSISPLADVLKSQLKFTDSDIGLLQGIYSFPNIIMVLIGGFIIDRIGPKKSALIFSFFVFTGALVTMLKGNIFVMATGRLIFGLGAESMVVAITTVIAQWFKGNQLSFAFGLNLTVARLGTYLALISPGWGKGLYQHWQNPLKISVVAGFVCIVMLVVYYILDTYSQNKYVLVKEDSQDKVILSEIFSFKIKRFLSGTFLLIIVAILFNFVFKVNQSSILQIFTYIFIIVFSLLNYKSFIKSYWYIVLLCITFYSAIFPFQTFANKFFQETHHLSRENAGFLSGILTLAAMFCTPFFGLLSDYLGKRSLLMMLGSLLIIPVYLLMGYTNINLIIPMCIMGISFSLVPAIMWPSVSLVSQPSKLGTAYGLMTMIQNTGLFGFNLIIGWANDFSGASAANPAGYHLGMWIFSSLGILGFIFAFMLRINEGGKNGYGLEKGIWDKK
jgi:MFS family permease